MAAAKPSKHVCGRATPALLFVAACGQAAEVTPPPRESPRASLVTQPGSPARGQPDAGAGALASDAGASTGDAKPRAPCPEDMVYIETTYCPNVQLKCQKDEYDKPNHLTICHQFAPGQVCLGKPRKQRFCIDRYEYPNEKGAHPPVMVDWYDAMGACAAGGKRLCWESEWVSACEGPDKLPFPYGSKRDSAKCNIDNRYISPDIDRVYSKKPAVQDAELLRLDQSTPSGDKEGCVSGFGVHDLTGNFDEWVIAEEEIGDSKWARLKGGGWGHVRNACRPYTTKHPPEFTYYFISFRCCADPAPEEGQASDPALWKPPPPPDKRDPAGKISPGWTPKKR